jgi:hypothetical protein
MAERLGAIRNVWPAGIIDQCRKVLMPLQEVAMHAGIREPRSQSRTRDQITAESLRAELAAARQSNRQLRERVQALERRLSSCGPTVGPTMIDHHPTVVELRSRMAQT